jgi:hypothetical protein
MPAEKQAIIDRTGNRESFLRGDITFTDSKRQLRESGVRQGILKPLRPRQRISDGQRRYDDTVIEHLKDEGLDQAERWDEKKTRQRLAVTKRDTKRVILSSDRATLRRQAKRRADEFEDDGYDFNPYWYH